jgi:putative tricarboxylic transport membrane protein
LISEGWSCDGTGESKGFSMKKRNYLSGFFFFGLAIVLFVQTRGLTIWSETGPSEGFFPLALSILLGFLSLIMMILTFLKSQQTPEPLKFFGENKKKFLLYLGSFVLFGLTFSEVGFSLTLAAFMIFILKMVERQTWKMTLSVMIVSVMSSFIVFEICFTIPLPEGILSSVTQLLK